MGIQVAPRISFRQMHVMGLGKSLSYVFVPAYFASQILCFVLSCGILVASMSSVDSIPFKRCSHISMGVLILLIIEFVMLILSNRCASFQVETIISTFTRSPLCFSKRCSVSFVPSCLCFPTLTPFFLKDTDFLIKYPSY